MADEKAPVEKVDTAPVVEAPVVETKEAPVVVEETKLSTDVPTLLEEVKAPEAPKVEEKPEVKVEEVKTEGDKPEIKTDAKTEEKPKDEKTEAKPEVKTEAVKPEPVEYKYTLPETIKMDDALRTETHAAFDAFRADPTNPQPLIDLHNKTMTNYAEHLSREQHRIFNDTRKGWQKEIMADPEIGGPGHQTAAEAIARVRDMFMSTHQPESEAYKKDEQAFDGMLRVTGVGDHPVFWRFLHNIARMVDEPQAHEIPTQIKAAPVQNGKKGASVLYDNPRSVKPQ